MVNIIFLDIEGVLTNDRDVFPLKKGIYPASSDGFNPVSIHLLKTLVKRHNVQIVVTSSLRLGLTLKEVKGAYFLQYGLADNISGKTRHFAFYGQHGNEILDYLRRNKLIGKSNVIIIDDDADMNGLHNRHVWVDRRFGLRYVDIVRISRLLRG